MEDKKTLHILHLCGFGDAISTIARFQSLIQAVGETHDIKFYLGGFGKSPQFSKELIDRIAKKEGYPITCSIVKNLTVHSQIQATTNFIKDKLFKPGDLFEDWSFCFELFANKEIQQSKYMMNTGFNYVADDIEEIPDRENYRKVTHEMLENSVFGNYVVAIHPVTTAGNFEGFEWHKEHGRFWEKEKWIQLLHELHEEVGIVPMFTGIGDEDWGLREVIDVPYIDAMGLSIDSTINVLSQADGCISVNTWDWEITSRADLPTFCFYTTDVHTMFYKVHVPEGPDSFWNNCFIEKDRNVSVEDVKAIFLHMLETKKRHGFCSRPFTKFSVGMISYNDEDCIERTLRNVMSYEPCEFVVTDGGSVDATKEILLSKDSITVIDKPWEDDFELQKNTSLDNIDTDWIVWIDADETYEHLFWNQLPWYIWLADRKGIDCISVPRINTIEGLSQDEINTYAQENGWQLSGYSWIQYPDFQQRVFKKNCRFSGRTHERVVGAEKEAQLVGVHCLHPKTKERQERGLNRERRQHEIEAKKIKDQIEDVERKEGY